MKQLNLFGRWPARIRLVLATSILVASHASLADSNSPKKRPSPDYEQCAIQCEVVRTEESTICLSQDYKNHDQKRLGQCLDKIDKDHEQCVKKCPVDKGRKKQ